MIVLIVTQPGTPRGLLAYAFDLAGLDTREILSVRQADYLARQFGFGNCVVVIEAELLSEAPESRIWRAFLRSRLELRVVVTACGPTNHEIRDLVVGNGRMLLQNPFDAAAVVEAVRRAYDHETTGSSARRSSAASRSGSVAESLFLRRAQTGDRCSTPSLPGPETWKS